MDAVITPQFLSQWLGLIVDTGLALGFFFLWLSWYRNGKRQQHLEQILLSASSQLEEATRHLSQATVAIEQLKQLEQSNGNRSPQQVMAKRTKQPSVAATPAPQNSTQATMILRMKREGESPQTIAERLDMPLAQVKLLLKLHAASSPVD